MNPESVLMSTPGKQQVRVNVLEREWPVRQWMAKDMIAVPLLDESAIGLLARMDTERIGKNRDCPSLWTGDPGLGKSTGTVKVARKVDPDFSVDDVAFRLKEFSERFGLHKQGDASKGYYPRTIMDEAGYAMYGPEWLRQEQRVFAKHLIVSRIKRQCMDMAVPKPKLLNHYVRDRAFIWVHITEPQEYMQGYGIVRLAPPELQSEWHPMKYWVPKFVFIFTAESGKWWDEYEKRKIEFVDDVLANDSVDRNENERRNDVRDFLIRKHMKDHDMSTRDFAEMLKKNGYNLSHVQVSRINKQSTSSNISSPM